MRSKLFVFGLALVSSVSLSFAADCDYGICLDKIGGFINNLNTSVVAALGTLFLAVAVVGFFLGVVRFIWAQQQGEEKGVKAGKETLKWGLLALFCAFSVYGIIRFGQSVFFGANADDVTKIKVPKFIIDPTSTGQSTNQGTYSGQSTNQGTYSGQSINQGTYSGQSTNQASYSANTSDSSGNRNSAAGGVTANSSGSFSSGANNNPLSQWFGTGENTLLNPALFKSGSASSDLSSFIKKCQTGTSKSYAECWQEYSKANPVKSNTTTVFDYNACINSGKTKAECQLRADAAAMGVPVDMPTQNPAPQETYYNYTPQEETYYNYIPADQGSGNSTEETYDYGRGSNNSADETYYSYPPSGGDDGGSGQSADYANTDPDYTP